MGQLIKWAIPTDADVSYDMAYIYRASSESGAYSQLTAQAIANNEYFDLDGTESNWYKVRFYDSAAIKWSDYSDPLQGGTYYGYCSIDDIRDLTDLSETDISDSKIFTLIKYAMATLNADIQVEHKDEEVKYISPERENKVDGTNKTFYIQFWPLGDKDNNGSVSITDIYAYSIDADGLRTARTLESIDNVELGKFTMVTAPPSDETFYISYFSTPLLIEPPHMLIRTACIQLTAALCYTKIDASKIKKFRVGKVSIMQQSEAYDTFYNNYQRTINKIRSKPLKGRESVNYV